MAVPLYLLYELSIFLSAIMYRRRQRSRRPRCRTTGTGRRREDGGAGRRGAARVPRRAANRSQATRDGAGRAAARPRSSPHADA